MGSKTPIFLCEKASEWKKQHAWEEDVFVRCSMVGVMNEFNEELVEY